MKSLTTDTLNQNWGNLKREYPKREYRGNDISEKGKSQK